MSKDKQGIKLYTEKQVREAIEMAREGIRSKDSIIGSLNFIKPPIELPSDSEIEEHFTAIMLGDEYKFFDKIQGAIWLRDKLQGGNNEQQ